MAKIPALGRRLSLSNAVSEGRRAKCKLTEACACAKKSLQCLAPIILEALAPSRSKLQLRQVFLLRSNPLQQSQHAGSWQVPFTLSLRMRWTGDSPPDLQPNPVASRQVVGVVQLCNLSFSLLSIACAFLSFLMGNTWKVQPSVNLQCFCVAKACIICWTIDPESGIWQQRNQHCCMVLRFRSIPDVVARTLVHLAVHGPHRPPFSGLGRLGSACTNC